MEINQCFTCKKPFIILSSRKKYCSHECYLVNKRKPSKVCKKCGKQYPYYGTGKYYCSYGCERLDRDRIKKGSQIKCKKCGKEKYFYKSSLKRKKQPPFCSKNCWYVYSSGKNNPHYGKKHTEKTKEDNRIKHLGKKATEETKEKLRIIARKNARFGNRSNFWKGGIATLQNNLRNTWQYKEWRKKCFERDKYSCRICKFKGSLRCHHIKYFSQIIKEKKIKTIKEALQCKELFDIDNGLTVCHGCHKEIHGRNIPF